eukprot:3926192-Amphidinium_carterae.1
MGEGSSQQVSEVDNMTLARGLERLDTSGVTLPLSFCCELATLPKILVCDQSRKRTAAQYWYPGTSIES